MTVLKFLAFAGLLGCFAWMVRFLCKDALPDPFKGALEANDVSERKFDGERFDSGPEPVDGAPSRPTAGLPDDTDVAKVPGVYGRGTHGLREVGAPTLREARKMSDAALLAGSGVGRKTVEAIRAA